MRARSPVYVIAFDACDHNVVQAFARAGHLPNFQRMLERAARCKLENPVGLFLGALWLNFATTICARLGVTLEDVDGRVVPWLAGQA
jgi:hypothetical protein